MNEKDIRKAIKETEQLETTLPGEKIIAWKLIEQLKAKFIEFKYPQPKEL